MLKIFRTNKLLLSVLLIGYAAFLRIAYFITPLIEIPTEPGLGNHWIAPLIKEPSILSFIIIILLLAAQGLIVNKIFFDHRFYRNLSLFSGVFLILTGSMLPSFLGYSSYLPANLFLLLAILEILKTYRKSKVADVLFNTGFFIGLAALFQPIYLIFLLVSGVVVINLKSGKFRDQFILITGAAIPLFLIGTYYFWTDQFALAWTQQWAGAFGFPHNLTVQTLTSPFSAIMLALAIWVFIQYGTILSKTKMEVQVKINTLYWFFAGALLVLLLSPAWHIYRWQAIVPMLGLLLGVRFTKARHVLAEAWHLVFVILLFLFHFLNEQFSWLY